MSKKALVIIDLQNYYINKTTKYLPSKIKDYIESNNFKFILFTKYINNLDTNMIKVFNWREMLTPPDIDICDTLIKYTNKKNVFQKDTYSAFKSKQFKKYLEKNNITELFICGLDTDACVLATAYEGFDLGYKINVLDNLTASHCGNDFRKFGLEIINKNIQKPTKKSPK